MIMRTLILCICSVLMSTGVYCQELVFSEPVALSKLINTDDEELAPLLSPDGKTLYFIRAYHEGNTGGKFAGSDIWMSKKDDQGQWMPPARMEFGWNNKRANAVIGISQDQTVVYLLNAYSNKSGIAFSKFNSGLWGEPEFIPIPGIAKDDFVGFYVHPQFDVILISMRGKDTMGEEDIYISLKDSFGNWTEPRNLGPTINTKGFEISPFLSEDKKRLYFSSNGHGGYGDADIFYCERLFDSWDVWSVPRNLGATVNAGGFDSYFSIYGDTIAFYARSSDNKSNLFRANASYSINVLPPGSTFLASEELNEIYPKRLSMRLDFNKNISTLSNDQNEIIWFVSNRVLTKNNINILLWVREEEDNLITMKRTAEIIRTMRLVGIDDKRISISSQRTKPELNEQGGVIEILLFK